MQNPVSVTDLENRWRTFSDEERVVARAWLADGWELLKANVSGLEANIEAGITSLGMVRLVVCTAVLRVLKNPNALRQESIDDSMRVRTEVLAAGELFYSPEDLSRVRVENDAAFSIRPQGSRTYPAPRQWTSPTTYL